MTTAPKRRTITLTGRPPVRILESAWPIIAHGEWTDNPRIPQQANATEDVRVRQHADGRAIVYGVTWSAWQGSIGWSGGELLAPGADLPSAIERVAADGGMHESVARECIADLPPIDL